MSARSTRLDADGFVYFIQASDGPIKIGWSGEPIKRLADLQVSHHARLTLLLSCPCKRLTEKKVHWWFRDLRRAGEWFSPEKKLLDAIASLRSNPESINDRAEQYQAQHFEESRKFAEAYNEQLNELIHRMVERFGGVEKFALAMGRSVLDTQRRLRGDVVGGIVQRLWIDHVAVLCTDPDVAEMYVFGLCDMFGYERPRRLTAEELAAVKRGAA